jgi:hypothetical protein
MRNPGRPSQQLSLVPPTAIDAKFGRPPAPEDFSEPEVRLWERLVLARRPNWYLGSEAVLQTYVSKVINNQKVEQALRGARAGPSARYVTLSRLHRQGALLAATLATRLRLTRSTAIDKTLALALKVVEARGDKPSDPKIWRQLITYAPRWVVLGAAFRLREERRMRVQRRASGKSPARHRRRQSPSQRCHNTPFICVDGA